MSDSEPRPNAFDLLLAAGAFGETVVRNLYIFTYRNWTGDRGALREACQEAATLIEPGDLGCTFTLLNFNLEEQRGSVVYKKSRTFSKPPRETATISLYDKGRRDKALHAGVRGV